MLSDDKPPRYLLAGEAACESRVSYYTFLDWLKSGKLPAHKAGRKWLIKRSDLDAFLAGEK